MKAPHANITPYKIPMFSSFPPRVLAKTVTLKNKIVYRAQCIPFVTNINYLKGIFAQLSASVHARVFKIYFDWFL